MTLSLFLSTCCLPLFIFFFSSRRRHTRFDCDWSSDVCSSDLELGGIRAILECQKAARLVGQNQLPHDRSARRPASAPRPRRVHERSEEHTSELQSQSNLVCRLLLEKKKNSLYAITPYGPHSALPPL